MELKYVELKSDKGFMSIDLSKDIDVIMEEYENHDFNDKKDRYRVQFINVSGGYLNIFIYVMDSSIDINQLVRFYDSDFKEIEIDNYYGSPEFFKLWQSTNVDKDMEVVIKDFGDYILALDKWLNWRYIIKIYFNANKEKRNGI